MRVGSSSVTQPLPGARKSHYGQVVYQKSIATLKSKLFARLCYMHSVFDFILIYQLKSTIHVEVFVKDQHLS
jgi:hypothetical protein